MNNHGRNFSITNANQLESQRHIPTRSKLLDQQLVATTQKTLTNKQPLLFLGNDVAQSIQKNQYELILHGIAPCGSKTTITVTGIYPYVDVHVEPNGPVNKQVTKLKMTLDNHDIEFKSIKVVDGKNFMKYHEEQRKYMRVYFDTLKQRLRFIKLCLETNVKTFSNDQSTYYRVAAREYEINLSGWNMIKSYKRVWGTPYKSEITLSIDIKDICSFDPDSQTEQVANSGYPAHVFKYERMIIASFDIEMIPFHKGQFPDADKCSKDSIFMICVTFHYAKKLESLLNVNLTLKENDPLDELVTIVCSSESCLLLAFSKLIDMVQPDFITEFNGSGFDWRNVIKKAQYFGVISTFLRNMSIVQMQPWELKGKLIDRYYKTMEIKLDGATASPISMSLKMQGYVNFDTLIVFKQIEPKADSHKLNECLKRCNLGSKDDLDIQEMFNIYLGGTSTQMKMVAHYCFIDTFKLQALLLKKNVIQDRREVSNLSMTSIHDAFYYANGSKVRNILMNVGEKRGYKFDTTYKPPIKNAEDKFPGAFVVPPIKGIVRPMFTYTEFMKENKLPIDSDELAHGYHYLADNYDQIIDRTFEVSDDTPTQLVPYINYMLTNETHYPISGLDFASLYPSLIMTYNISPETLITDQSYADQMVANGHKLKYVTFPFLGKDVEAWFVQHNNDTTQYGLCPAILIDLFAKRAAIKKIMKPLEASKKHMEIEMNDYASADEYPHMEKYKEICFDFDYIDAKQKALKVFMNTFYGEMGNFVSFICAVETAASVTTMGRYNLRLAKTYVEESDLRMKVYYGDSVIGDTPIMIKRMVNGIESNELIPIEELGEQFEQYSGGKECIDYSNADLYVMTDDGYSKVNKLIRHKTDKQLYRVTTHIGSVIVTEDHSLLDAQKQKIKPSECVVGTSLLHWQGKYISMDSTLSSMNLIEEPVNIIGADPNDIGDTIAFVQGFFFGDGCCGEYDCPSGKKYTFALNNQDLGLLNKCVRIFNRTYADVSLKIIDTMESSGVYKAIAIGKVAKLVRQWRSEFYSSRKHKKVPQFILNADRQTKLFFMQGYYAADGDKKYHRLSNKGQIGTQGLLLLLIDLGYDTSVSVRADKPLIYRVTFTKGKQRCKDITAIKSIEKLGSCDGYVYDLETESHHFAAGVGQMVVHNTDSLYVACNKSHFYEYDRRYFTGQMPKLEYCTELVRKTFELIEITKVRVNNHLRADNGSNFLKMAYEEVLFPVVFVSKKKYFGIPHVDVIDFFPTKAFERGLETIKRGSSDVLKDVCGKVVLEILDINTTCDMLTLVNNATKRFFTTEWDVRHFIKTAVYRPDKQNVSVRRMIARYVATNYPIIPEPNVRFKYVICKRYMWTYNDKGTQTILSIGDRMELVERVLSDKIPIDLEYYFNNEITGQMARFIAFHPEFDTIDRDTLKDTLTEKERYDRVEGAMFKNAKSYIAKLAQQYSNPYQNKSILFKQTYKMVADSIRVKHSKTKKITSIYPPNVIRVTQILAGCNEDRSLAGVRTKVEQYIQSKYKLPAAIANLDMEELFRYISDHELFHYLKDCSEEWISKIVQHIRKAYDYERICVEGLNVSSVLEIFTKEELNAIIADDSLYVGLTDAHATIILDIISRLVAKYT
jgi:DNA polymerase elongation subunit (family B)